MPPHSPTHPCSLPVPTRWETAITTWLASLAAGGLSATSRATRADHLRRLARAIGGNPFTVTAEQLLDWAAGQSWAPETRRSVYASVRGFYGWAQRCGRVKISPAAMLPRVRAGQARPRPTPEAIYAAARAAADDRTRLILDLAAQLGMRRAEIAQVHADDISPALIGATLVAHGKGGKDRDLPLLEPLQSRLVAACAAGHGWAFPGDMDGHLSPQRVGNLASRLMPQGWTLHTLRHRAGTVAFAGERDLLAVQAFLGHASVATTQRYVKPPADGVQRAVEWTSGLRVAGQQATQLAHVGGQPGIEQGQLHPGLDAVGLQFAQLVALAALAVQQGLEGQLLPVLGILEGRAAVGGGQGDHSLPGGPSGANSGHGGDDGRHPGQDAAHIHDQAA